MPTGLQVVPWPNRGSLSAPAEPSQSCESLEASDQALPEAVPSRTCADGAATSAPVDQAVQQSLQTLPPEQQAQRNQRNAEAACPATCAQPLSKAAPVSVPQATLQDQSHETKVPAEHAPKALIPEVPLPKPSVQAPVPDQKGKCQWTTQCSSHYRHCPQLSKRNRTNTMDPMASPQHTNPNQSRHQR